MVELYFAHNLEDKVVTDGKEEEEGVVDFTGRCGEVIYPTQNALLKAALNLKDEVVQATWTQWGFRCRDPTMYTGLSGTAFVCFKSYQMTGNVEDLALCSEMIDACAAASRNLRNQVTFLCGKAGIYALGAVVAKYKCDNQRSNFYLNLFHEISRETALSVGPEEGGFGMPYELLYGRAGFLYAALFVNKYLGEETIPWTVLGPIVEAVIAGGRAGASNTVCPLMYQWHGTRYWGAAHGLAGIMNVLLHFPLSKEDAADVKGTLHYMIRNRCLPSKNYPSSEGNSRDKLVQWCHGAPGVAITLCKAAQVFPGESAFHQAAIEAGELVWKKGLVRKVGLCHGISGNTYTFLALYRLTKEKLYLNRAKAFAGFLYNNGRSLIASGQMHGGDHPYSLFEGLGGTAYLWFDMVKPDYSRFPGFEL
uniref:LanC-like protein GCL1 n=1 Tax=Araucaria cunninghamii TaxID=56994 RepID=A0A0D6QWX3_ARACU